MKQAHVFISGFVQGVRFRKFIKDNAQKLEVNGWARNTRDNRVEALFEGKEENVKKLIEVCNKGPFFAEVKDVVVEWEEAQQMFENFQIM